MASSASGSQVTMKQLLSTLAPQNSALGKAPISLAKGPYWARLPPIRPRESSSQSAESQNMNVHATTAGAASSTSAIPPIIAPDRISTTRVLLQDTQACVQKFATRMDKLSSSVEQGVKDVQMCRNAMEGTSEKAIADIADIVHKSQILLTKELENHKTLIESTTQSISRVIMASDSLTKLYEAQSASLQSLTQMYHTQQRSLQAVQEQQCQIIQSLAPLEALIKAIPLQFEANQSNLVNKVVEATKTEIPRAVESALENLDIGNLASRLSAELEVKLGRSLNGHVRGEISMPSDRQSPAPNSDAVHETPNKRKRSISIVDITDDRPGKISKTMDTIAETVANNAATFAANMEIILAATSQESSSGSGESGATRSSRSGQKSSKDRLSKSKQSRTTVAENSRNEDFDQIPVKQLTQTRLNFGAQKPITQRPTLAPIKHSQRALRSLARNLQRSQTSSAVVHTSPPKGTSGNRAKDVSSSVLSSEPTSAKNASSTNASNVSSAVSKVSKTSTKDKSKSKSAGKRIEKKRPTLPALVRDQNTNTTLAKEIASAKARIKSVTPTKLGVTTSNEVSVASEHDPPNSPSHRRTLIDTESCSGATQLKAQLQDLCKRSPLAPVQPMQEMVRLEEEDKIKRFGLIVPSSSTLIDLLGDGREVSPDWNMAGAADAMDKAERDLDPLSVIPSSDSFLAVTGDPSSSIARPAGRQRRTLVLESDSPGVDLWFDDLLDA